MQPIYNNARGNARAYQNQFGGLNRSPSIADAEISDMGNLSSDRFPFLSPSRAREAVASMGNIEAVIAPRIVDGATITAFTGVAADKFYYNGVKKLNLTAQEQPRCLVDFNGNILIFPDKQYYSYVEEEGGDLEVGTDSETFTFSSSGSAEDSTLECWIVRDTDWGELFQSGDSLRIETGNADIDTLEVTSKYEQADDEAIVSCVVNRVDGKRLYVTNVNRKGEKVAFPKNTEETGTVRRGVPDILRACVYNNRVFGYDASGERLYASKLGDARNWYCYEGLSTDGWYSEVGTEGGFTGIAASSVGVVALKNNYLHLVYGDSPRNFTLQPQIPAGCIDGRSVANVQQVLFFLGYDGVYAFSGGYPSKVSDALDMRYQSGVGGGDGEKYYLSAKRPDGTFELVVYDLARGMWHREDTFAAAGFFRYNNGFYGADTGKVYRMDGQGYADSWYAVSKRFDDGTMENRGLNNLYLRLFAEAGATVTVEATTADGDTHWQMCGSVSGPFHGVKRFPVRFCSHDAYRYRISGAGHAEIEAIERVLYSGGREER